MSAVDISFKVSNEISSWQQTVEFYFDENCWQNLQKYGFSFCGKLNVYGVYSCSGNSDTNSPLNASSTSVVPHPPLIRPKGPVIFGLLLILQLYPLAVFLIHFCPSVTLHCNCPTSDSHHLLCELFHFPPIFPVFFSLPPFKSITHYCWKDLSKSQVQTYHSLCSKTFSDSSPSFICSSPSSLAG